MPEEMTPKERFDALATLWSEAYKRIQERRDGEYKFFLAIWAGAAGLDALILKKDSLLSDGDLVLLVLLLLGGAALCAIQYWFLRGIGKGHDRDRKVANDLFVLMKELAHLPDREPRHGQGRVLDWSRGAQLAVTVLLIAFPWALVLTGRMPHNRALGGVSPATGRPCDCRIVSETPAGSALQIKLPSGASVSIQEPPAPNVVAPKTAP